VRERCIFAHLDGKELERRTRRVRFAKREMIFHEGDRAFGLYVIYRGKVKLFKRTLNGRRQILQILGPADLLGEEGLIREASRQASAQALTDVELLFLSHEDFRVLLKEGSVEQRLMARLLDRQRRLEELLLQVRYHRAEERLDAVLRRLAQEHGRPLANGVLIDLELTQAELGEFCGLTREAVNKHLMALKDQGLIAFQGRKILYLKNPDPYPLKL